MIALKQLTFRYTHTTYGLVDLHLTVKKKECVALIGQSGNGKTTLTRVINGLAPVHYEGDLQGEIWINGKDAKDLKLWERSQAIGSVFQDPKSQFFSSELKGEIAFGMENFGYSQGHIQERTHEIMREYHLDNLSGQSLDTLSSGEKQKVAISSVLALSPEILVFDEPTANLDEISAIKLGEMIQVLKRKGYTMVIAEHRISYISSFVDRYIYIKDGEIAREFTWDQLLELSKSEKEAMGLRELISPKRHPLLKLGYEHTDDFLVEHLSISIKKKKIIENLSFSVNKSSIIAITGRNGVGKTTLAKGLCGLLKGTKGTIKLFGKRLKTSHLYRHIWYSSNDTNTQFFTNSLTEELLLLTEKTEDNLEQARNILKEISLYEWKDCHPQTLSGGQKQRLSIACGLLSGREILIFDEPTSGLDGKNLKIVSNLFKTIAQAGKIVLIISHDNELINACCDYELPLGG